MSLHHRPNAFLDTSSLDAAAQWDDLLTLQVDLFLPHELHHLAESKAWLQATTVVDVGCGNGCYLSRLRAFYPGKTYVGIDVSAELVGLANHRHRAPGLRFEQRDFLTEGAAGSDVILLRFVIQHLDDIAAVFDRAAKVLRPGGALIVVEPDFAQSRVSPAAPLFTGLLESFQDHQARLGRLRGCLSHLPALIGQMPQWQVLDDAVISIPSIGPFEGTKTLATFDRWIDLCERAGGFEYPFDETRKELGRWARVDSAFSRIALRMIHIVARASIDSDESGFAIDVSSS